MPTMQDHILLGMLSCVESSTLKRTIWPVIYLHWCCISKHTTLQGAETKLFKMESFLRLNSSNKMSAVCRNKQEAITHKSLLCTISMKQCLCTVAVPEHSSLAITLGHNLFHLIVPHTFGKDLR